MNNQPFTPFSFCFEVMIGTETLSSPQCARRPEGKGQIRKTDPAQK